MSGQYHKASQKKTGRPQSSLRRRHQWLDQRRRRYVAVNAFDIICALAVAFTIGLLFLIMFFRSDNGRDHHAAANTKLVRPVREAVRASSPHVPSIHIDPNFAHYLDALQKKRVDVLTGRKFLSVGQDSDGTEETNEKGSDDKDGFRAKYSRKKVRPYVVRLPSLLENGYNITRISQMLLRVIMTYEIQSVVDVPCRGHMNWMGLFLEGVSEKLPKPFVYFCVDSRRRVLDEMEEKMPQVDGVNTNFIQRRFWEVPLPRADLVFCWEGLEKMSLLHARALMDGVMKQDHHRFAMMGSMPRVTLNSNSGLVNVRKSPFSYRRPARIFKELMMNTTEGHDEEKHMYFYEVDEMRNRGNGKGGK